MLLDPLVELALSARASDIHLEPGLPAGLRVDGQLRTAGEPQKGSALLAMARELLEGELWPSFLARRSADFARSVRGVRCRFNVFCTARGVGMAIRMLASHQPTVEQLNLHPDLKSIVRATHGLVLVSGPTGSGKSSTLAALVEEVNRSERRHIVTIESPIEYPLVPRLSFVRQREVERDTPSFEQGLKDALREDPDVLVVGEMRDAETMRLTLLAAETGHLVLTTLHSATVGEALARIASAFPAEIQANICAQLADSLVAVVCQRMRFFPNKGLRAPECEVLLASTPVRAVVRQGHFFKLQTALETLGREGCFTFQRYREWLDGRTDWFVPTPSSETVADVAEARPVRAPPAPRKKKPTEPRPGPAHELTPGESGVIAIDDADDDLDGILSELEGK
ncbi:MAG TPA: ATPase, T2SS/T4P/T4SS family [Anaeromyxobacteraceae bacterium]|nr:ATPase, T2SS/T4P/T4SS family [Anaeromyxobacteraceae bacterium]